MRIMKYINISSLFYFMLKFQAAKIILKALQDETVGTAARQILFARGELLIKRKKNGLSNRMKETLNHVLGSPLKEPPSRTISALSLPKYNFKFIIIN